VNVPIQYDLFSQLVIPEVVPGIVVPAVVAELLQRNVEGDAVPALEGVVVPHHHIPN
jgi:hypothetical protein